MILHINVIIVTLLYDIEKNIEGSEIMIIYNIYKKISLTT